MFRDTKDAQTNFCPLCEKVWKQLAAGKARADNAAKEAFSYLQELGVFSLNNECLRKIAEKTEAKLKEAQDKVAGLEKRLAEVDWLRLIDVECVLQQARKEENEACALLQEERSRKRHGYDKYQDAAAIRGRLK